MLSNIEQLQQALKKFMSLAAIISTVIRGRLICSFSLCLLIKNVMATRPALANTGILI